MKIEEYIQVKVTGSGIDPFLDYTLLAQFQTNSPYTLTFDPTIIASSGEYAWDLGDGTILFNDKAVSHTYATTAIRTVKLYGKGTCTITGVDFNSDNIVGVLNLSHVAFATVTTWNLHINNSMTNILFPSTITATVSSLSLYQIGITGTFDLSMFTTFSTSAGIYAYSNPSMTGVTFANSVTGTFHRLYFHSSPISGTFNLSMFSTFTSSSQIMLYSNTVMTGVTFASSITGTFTYLYIHNTGITGTLDLSKFTSFANVDLQLQNNTSLTGVTFASSISGQANLFDRHYRDIGFKQVYSIYSRIFYCHIFKSINDRTYFCKYHHRPTCRFIHLSEWYYWYIRFKQIYSIYIHGKFAPAFKSINDRNYFCFFNYRFNVLSLDILNRDNRNIGFK
jgi:hypothetical protein